MIINKNEKSRHTKRDRKRLHVPSELPKEAIAGRTSVVHLAPLAVHQPNNM